jgi:amino acid transporter
LFLLLPFPSWRSLIGLITGASVLMYAGAPLSLGVFRQRLPDAPRPYRLPAANFLSPFAFFVANLIILWSGWDTDWKLGVAILIGYVILAASRIFHLNDRAVALNWRSASWLPVYLVGMGLITYLSTFGPAGVIPLWWDLVVVAVFSVIIYFWAIRVGLPKAQIEEMIEEVVLPEEEGVAGVAH